MSRIWRLLDKSSNESVDLEKDYRFHWGEVAVAATSCSNARGPGSRIAALEALRPRVVTRCRALCLVSWLSRCNATRPEVSCIPTLRETLRRSTEAPQRRVPSFIIRCVQARLASYCRQLHSVAWRKFLPFWYRQSSLTILLFRKF